MQFDATGGEFDGEPGWMVKFLSLRTNRLVGDKPHVATTAAIFLVAPSRYVRLVLEGNSNRQTINLNITSLGEMED